jgi:hypothetical protein
LPFREWASSDVQYWIAGDETQDGKKPATRMLNILCNVIPVPLYRKSYDWLGGAARAEVNRRGRAPYLPDFF